MGRGGKEGVGGDEWGDGMGWGGVMGGWGDGGMGVVCRAAGLKLWGAV